MAEAKQPTIKRDYYRLVDLDKSPFNLSLEDALYLGSSGALSVYVRVTERVELSSRVKKSDPIYGEGFFLRLETVDLARIENDHLAGKHDPLSIHRGIVDKRYSEDLHIPDPIPFTPFVRSTKEQHKVCISTYSGYLDEPGYHSAFYFQKCELLCFTEDLEQLPGIEQDKDEIKLQEANELGIAKQQNMLTAIGALLEIIKEQPNKNQSWIVKHLDGTGIKALGESSMQKLFADANKALKDARKK